MTLFIALSPPELSSALPAGCTEIYDKNLRTYRISCPSKESLKPAKHNKPSCVVSSYFPTCVGDQACRFEKYTPGVENEFPPDGTKPSGANAYFRSCHKSTETVTSDYLNITTVWLAPAEAGVNLMVEARQAIGAITFPKARIATSPALMTAVGFDTTWWAEGIPTTPVKGTSALGLVATATPVGLVINPGGEENELSCPWTTTKDQATNQCTMVYQKSSIDGPAEYRDQPAHTVNLRTQWKLSFTFNGAPVTISNVPDITDGPTSTATLSVAEIQSLVGPNPTN